jgi:hypothetical protein
MAALSEVRTEMRDKRQKFIELANKRTNKALKDLRLVGNLANRASYDFSEDDGKKIVRAIQREVVNLKQRFGGHADESDQLFSLDKG